MSPRGDHSTFVSSIILPKSGQRTNVSIAKLDRTFVEQIVGLGVESIAGKSLSKHEFNSLKQKSSLNSADFDKVFSYVFQLLRTSVKHRTKFTPGVLKQQLVDNLQLPAQFAEIFVNVVFSPEIKNVPLLSTPRLHVCKYVKWRIDVLISNNYLSKIMEPVIVLELTLENGRKICFECKLIKFNQLRFAVASMLKVINNLEEKTILKPLDL